MNSSNLLDSLFAAGKTSPAPKKNTKQQASNQAAEGFQNAMAQVRPKVSARPTQKAQPQSDTAATQARKEIPRADSRPTSSNRPEKARDSKPETQPAEQHKHRPAADKTSIKDSPVQEESNTSADDNVYAEQGKGGDASAVGSTEKEGSTDSPLEQQSLLQPLVSLDVLLPQDQNLPLNEGALVNGLVADAASQLVTDLNLIPTTELASIAEPSTELNLDGLSEEELAALLVPESTNGVIAPSGVPNALAGSATASAAINSALGLNPLQGIAAGAVLPETAIEGELAFEGELALAPEATAGDELLAGSDIGDNPDLLLLNAKTVMAKLAEASASSLDKPAPVAELPKTLTATAPAIETLSRLAEAQSPTARGFVVQTGVPVPMGQPQWGQGVGERVLWLAAQNVSAAEIRLDPPELGPMQVRVSVNQEQVNVSFVSPHPAVRDALDQQLQRLREMFSEQGLNLGNVDVSDKSFSQQDQERDETARKGTVTLDNEELTPTASQIVISNRLVDHYA